MLSDWANYRIVSAQEMRLYQAVALQAAEESSVYDIVDDQVRSS